MMRNASLCTRLGRHICKLFPTKKKKLTCHASLNTHPGSSVSYTQVFFTMSTSTSLTPCVEPNNSLKAHERRHSTAMSLPQETTEPNIEDHAGSLEETTTQILPTRYVKNVDILVEVLQDMVGGHGDFQIEMRHTSYIVKSPIKIKPKELMERIVSRQRSGVRTMSVPDLQALGSILNIGKDADAGHGHDVLGDSNRRSLDVTGVGA